jgi:ComF family protein
LREIYLAFFEFLAPRRCLVCDDLISENPGKYEFICKKCELFLPATPEQDVIYNRFVDNFELDEIAITQVYGLFYIKGNHDYLKIIHGLKYKGFTRVGSEFGRELGKQIAGDTNVKYNGVVPVPIHHARLRERGFNQSLIIANAVAEVLGVPVVQPLKRKRYTTTQTQLTKTERTRNIRNAIVPKKRNTKLDGVYLLIDDVLTTGSTANVTAQMLLEIGARRVDCAVLAVA